MELRNEKGFEVSLHGKEKKKINRGTLNPINLKINYNLLLNS